MESFSMEASGEALALKRAAERLAARWRVQRGRPVLSSVPQEWTAWLLMDKAGMPRELIARCARLPLDHVVRRLRAATAMMIFPPYAAHIERLKGQMPRYQPAPFRRQPREAVCAVLAD